MKTIAKIYIRDNSDRHWKNFGKQVVIANLFQDNRYVNGYSGSSLEEVESWLENKEISHNTHINVQNLSVAPDGRVYSCD